VAVPFVVIGAAIAAAGLVATGTGDRGTAVPMRIAVPHAEIRIEAASVQQVRRPKRHLRKRRAPHREPRRVPRRSSPPRTVSPLPRNAPLPARPTAPMAQGSNRPTSPGEFF